MEAILDNSPQLTEAQIRTESELVERLADEGLRFERRRANLERRPYYVEGFVKDLHVWIYGDGGASIVGPEADLMIEKEDFRGPSELRAAVIDTVLRLSE